MFEEYYRIFIKFLVSDKGYPVESILTNTEMRIGPKLYYVDLAVLDIYNKSYLCAFDFKYSKANVTYSTGKKYRTLSSEHLEFPYFIVTFDNKNKYDDNFKIFITQQDILKEINKEDFPHYKTLSAKINAEEKIENINIQETKLKSEKSKKNIIRETAISSLASMFIAATVIFFLTKDQKEPLSYIKYQDDSISILLNSQKKEIELVSKKLKSVESSLAKLDSNKKNQLNNLNLLRRIEKLEHLTDANPEQVFKIQELANKTLLLQKDNENLKEIVDIKTSNLINKIDNLSIWTSGLLFVIFSSIIGFAFNTFKKS